MNPFVKLFTKNYTYKVDVTMLGAIAGEREGDGTDENVEKRKIFNYTIKNVGKTNSFTTKVFSDGSK